MMQQTDVIPFKKVKAWFFDLDGTLMDTDDQTVESIAHRLRLFGPSRAPRLARRIVMMSETPMNNLLTMLDIVGLDAVFFGMRRMLSSPMQPTFRLIEGVKSLLVRLAEHYQLAIVSTRSQKDADAFLQQHALTEFFQLAVTQESTSRLKPHPEPILYAAHQLGISPEACIMVGDTPVDIISARRAGTWAVGVLCGFGEEDELWRYGAHLVLPSTADLLPIVQSN